METKEVIDTICKVLVQSSGNEKAGSYLKQRLAIAALH